MLLRMNVRPRIHIHLVAATLIPMATLTVYAQSGNADQMERGRYLVVEVAKCGDCHTPTGPEGPDKAKWLKGGPLASAPIGKPPKWEDHAPDLTPSGRLFERWEEKGIVTFLVTGKGPRGNAADPPMPTFTLKQADAEAIVAYLKTLK